MSGLKRCVIIFAFLSFTSNALAKGDHYLGFMAGLGFPKLLIGKVQLNVLDTFAFDIQASSGFYWGVLQGDLSIFVVKGQEWNFLAGLGYESWRFYNFTSPTQYNNVNIGKSASASAIGVPLSLQYISDSGFAVEFGIGASIFVNGPEDLQGKIIPTAQFLVGLYL